MLVIVKMSTIRGQIVWLVRVKRRKNNSNNKNQNHGGLAMVRRGKTTRTTEARILVWIHKSHS